VLPSLPLPATVEVVQVAPEEEEEEVPEEELDPLPPQKSTVPPWSTSMLTEILQSSTTCGSKLLLLFKSWGGSTRDSAPP
jgi:hypothetical protein